MIIWGILILYVSFFDLANDAFEIPTNKKECSNK